MTTISLEVPADLAQQLVPLKPHLTEILKVGLRYWKPEQSLTPRQRVEQLWATTNLIVPLNDTMLSFASVQSAQKTPIQAGGKPASEIIIEQRGIL